MMNEKMISPNISSVSMFRLFNSCFNNKICVAFFTLNLRFLAQTPQVFYGVIGQTN